MKGFNRIFLLVAFFVMPELAWAQVGYPLCHVLYPNGDYISPGRPYPIPGPNPLFRTIVYRAPGFNLSFNPNVPNGTILFKKAIDFTPAGESGTLDCGAAGRLFLFYYNVVGDWVSKTYYQTSIPGVGMAITSWGEDWPAISKPISSPVRLQYGLKPWTLTITLVKTGEITTGGVITGRVGIMNTGYSLYYPPILSFEIGGGIVVDPQVPTCRVNTPAIMVPLGNMPASTFTGVGTPAPSKPFNIELECSGIETGKNLNVYTTLTDHTNPGNVSDTLTLAKDSTATGVGIQVLNGSTVVKYGPDSSAIGNKNQWKAGATGNGTFTIPLNARYIQTAPKVTPGTANGLATFTMSYQ